MEILKYPIGKFNTPATSTEEHKIAWIESIESLPAKLKELVKGWTEEQFNTPYREGAWTVRQLIHHIADSHMNSLIRFKWGLTEDSPKIKTYNQAKWAELEDSKSLHPSISIHLLEAVHLRFVCLLKNMTEDDYAKEIFHPEMDSFISLTNMLALYAWHSDHHLAQIFQLKEQKKW